ncbi:MAG: Dyp-type peroxidase [Leptospirillia bacterium]
MKKTTSQPLLLPPNFPYGLSMTWRQTADFDSLRVRKTLASLFDPKTAILGLGEPLLKSLSLSLPALRPFPAMTGPAVSVPSTQGSLWAFATAKSRSELFDISETLTALFKEDFELDDRMETFTYREGRDLSGYLDGTENPAGEAAVGVAIADGSTAPSGSSFVAVQRWAHDLSALHVHSRSEQDRMIGRELVSNKEIDDAPMSAHIKRSAQEDFAPPAFIYRKSMPWVSGEKKGLEFIAFGRSLDPFERILRRMTGSEDGVRDSLFAFSTPTTGSYYWCPPVSEGRLDLALS